MHGVRRNWLLSPQQKQDLRDALAILGDSGITLAEAAKVAMGKGAMVFDRITLNEAVSQFLTERKASLRPSSMAFYEAHLFPLCTDRQNPVGPRQDAPAAHSGAVAGHLWDWLADGPDEGPIVNVTHRMILERAQKVAGYLRRQRDFMKKWPHDAMRHSFDLVPENKASGVIDFEGLDWIQ